VDPWLTRVVAVLVVGLAGYLAYRGMPVRTPIVVAASDAGGGDAGAEAGADAGAVSPPDTQLGVTTDGGLDLDLAAVTGDAGILVGVLGDKAPRTVHIGVILVSFHGAQGASSSARPKQEARDLTARLAADAKTDFHGAVQRGDSGSSDDVGRIPRGVLESATEYAVFSLAAGEVTEAIETPRGFWIAKRLD
jgi:hypothetical protein